MDTGNRKVIVLASNRELEARFLNCDVARLRASLRSLNAKLVVGERLMRRRTFLFPNSLEDKWARVRDESDKITMTFKLVEQMSVDGTVEIELKVDDFQRACEFLAACGLKIGSYQENRRETWTIGDRTIVTLDTWPGLAPFVEIEASTVTDVRSAASDLGLKFEAAFFGGVDSVYERELGIPRPQFNELPEVSFENPPIHL